MVSVLTHAAAHTRRVVVNNTTNHARVDRSRVRSNFVLDRVVVLVFVICEDAINLTTDETRFNGNHGAITVDLVVSEVVFTSVTDFQEDRVGESLARERGTSSAEGDGDTVLLSNGENLLNLFFTGDFEDQFGVESVERSVSSVGKGAHRVCELTYLGNEACREI